MDGAIESTLFEPGPNGICAAVISSGKSAI